MGSSTKLPPVAVEASPTRCPWCHDDVDPRGDAWVACAGCLARHHQDCWHESERCATCGSEGRLQPVFGSTVGAKRRTKPGPTGKEPEPAATATTARIWPTLVVSKEHGPHRTIGEAIRAACGPTRILVMPGYYNESVVLDRPIAVVGEGPADKIVIEAADGDTISMQTERALVQGLTIRGRSGLRGERFSAVSIPGGELRLWDCDVSSACHAAAIVVRNTLARPVIRRCKIHDAKGGGVAFESGAAGTIEECELLRCRSFGIAVKSDSGPVVRDTTITEGLVGVFVTEDGRGVFERLDVFSQVEAGIRVSLGATPRFVELAVHEVTGAGVQVHDRCEATLDRATFRDCGEASVRAEHGGAVTVKECILASGRGHGIVATANGRAVVEGGRVTEHQGAGLLAALGGELRADRVRVRGNGRAGVWVRGGGSVRVEGCELRGNARAWEIDPGAQVFRKENRD